MRVVIGEVLLLFRGLFEAWMLRLSDTWMCLSVPRNSNNTSSITDNHIISERVFQSDENTTSPDLIV